MLTPQDCGTNSTWEIVLGGMVFRPIHLKKAGDQVTVHAHPDYDHVTLFKQGSVRVNLTIPYWGNAKIELIQKAGDHLLVPKGVLHEMTALEDDCFPECIFIYVPGHPQAAQ